MEIKTQLKALGERVVSLKSQIKTEEATKAAFVLPFFNLLGYDIFNPAEVIPEFTADIGIKKGEKVDYAICLYNSPIIIVECKRWDEKLDPFDTQLFRYFHVTKTRFALLTNGVEYKFYTDIDDKNKMDAKPWFEFDITKLKDSTIKEISKFHKSVFDVEKIISDASYLKLVKEIKEKLNNELSDSSMEFVRFFASKVYTGRLSEKMLLEFKPMVDKAVQQLISESINDRLQLALSNEAEKTEDEDIIDKVSKIETTEEELEGYRIVIAILRRRIDKSRISLRDTQSYFGILLDDSNRKPLCRLHLNGINKYISIFNLDKTETKHPINEIDDIYDFSDLLLETIGLYE